MAGDRLAASLTPPGLGPEERLGLRDFWDVYDAHYDEVAEELTAALAGDPELGPLTRAGSPEERRNQDQASRELTRRAVLADEWGPYLENLQGQGATYARAGLSFGAWLTAARLLRDAVTRRLFASYGGEPERFLRAINGMNVFVNGAVATIGEAYLRTKQDVIARQQEAIRELSTPVLSLRPGLLILPLVGVVDSHRARQVTEHLLEGIRTHRARVVVIDITGVPAVDSMVANHLIQTASAARLMGASIVVTGISTANAQTLVRIGIDPSSLNAVGDLQSGIEAADALLGAPAWQVPGSGPAPAPGG